MMDKRDFLRSKGFEVGKRGRFSADMLAALKEGGYDTKAPKAERPKVQAAKKVVVRAAPREVIARARSNRWVHVDSNGKRHEISDANAEFNCGYSLQFCHCPKPKATVRNFGYVDVVPA